MKNSMLLLSGLMVVSLLAGCGSPDQPPTKEEIGRTAKADWPEDYCDSFGWYGDGACDGFCPLPDSDCPTGQCQLMVGDSDPLFKRFEAPAGANDCRADGDCLASGCSGEVCAAESVVTTCEVLSARPAGECGCVWGKCHWHTGACEAGGHGECRASVDKTDPNYLRFEAPTSNNDCGADGDCQASGCSGEVCAAESLVTTCEAFFDRPAGTCGCVNGKCIWYTGSCTSGSGDCQLGVGQRDPYFKRFEAPTAKNFCQDDSDCLASGCSGEVCAAESLVTSCELLAAAPRGVCGCVSGLCAWHLGACAP